MAVAKKSTIEMIMFENNILKQYFNIDSDKYDKTIYCPDGKKHIFKKRCDRKWESCIRCGKLK